jgi:hypothetical protein
MASMAVAAQEEIVQHFEVPADGYSSTDTFIAGDLWNEYIVHVERGHELVYEFAVVGEGTITVALMPGKNPNIYSDYYVSYSTTQPVTSYSATFPEIVGFDRDYSILVNSSSPLDVEYTVSIHVRQAETPDYTIYYILIILGFVALVFFSYKFVVWQEKREKEEKRKERRQRPGRRRK